MEYQDYYQTLGVGREASAEEIKKAYRKLAMEHHPDHNPGDKRAEERFKQINEAYQVLSDPEKRAHFDRLGSAYNQYQRTGGAPGGFNWSDWSTGAPGRGPGGVRVEVGDLGDLFGGEGGFSDFFTRIFGGLGGEHYGGRRVHRPGQRQRLPTYEQPVTISLQEAFQGSTRRIEINGRRLDVNIPRGAKTGTKVRMTGVGPTSPDGRKADVYLVLEIAPDPRFSRKGKNLHTAVTVALTTAVLGGKRVVDTLDGSVTLTIPPGTQPGQKIRMKGKGMPDLKNPDQRGDLYAQVEVRLPKKLSPRQRELFDELARLEET